MFVDCNAKLFNQSGSLTGRNAQDCAVFLLVRLLDWLNGLATSKYDS